ncbi:MAG: hypothetical protein ACU0FH_16775 [Heliomarina sp.]|uniref:hypothetical protein n=1 Tax=Heliomarina sp. TaxID=2917556 RepID=UPI0040582CB4
MTDQAEKRGPGRPPGLPKTGGRKPGSSNKLPTELRQFINQRGRPLEFLAAIADGRKVSAADPGNPGKKIRVYPSLRERAAAAETLLSKLLPDLRATELTGKDGGPLEVERKRAGLADDDLETARQLAFILAKADHKIRSREQASMAIPKPAEEAAKEPELQPGDSEQIGQCTITLVERIGGRERWSIRNRDGELVGSAFGQFEATNKARALNEVEQ